MPAPNTQYANEGFRGMRKFVAHFNFSCNLRGNHSHNIMDIIVKCCAKTLKQHLN